MTHADAALVATRARLRRELERRTHVWVTDPQRLMASGGAHRLRAHLSGDERQRLAEFRFARDRANYLVAHGLLREILSCYADVAPADWRFVRGVNGKPHVAMPAARHRLSFNLSHTDGAVAVIVSARRACGVDVERIMPHIDADLLGDVVLSARERRNWRLSPAYVKVARFLESWTLKEAYLKGTGLGIAAGMQGVEVRRTGGDRAVIVDAAAPWRTLPWVLRCFHLAPGHVLSTAVRDTAGIGGAITIRRIASLQQSLEGSSVITEDLNEHYLPVSPVASTRPTAAVDGLTVPGPDTRYWRSDYVC